MSHDRIDFATHVPEAYRSLVAAGEALKRGVLGQPLLELVWLRVSQINGCAYCVDLHARALLKSGEVLQRINSLVTWREVTFYTPREQAALDWAEAVNQLAHDRLEPAYAGLNAHFNAHEVAELTCAVAVMNGLNRLAIPSRKSVPRAPLGPQ
ncbi:carboxymuconolactone decarboxylase family protein [Chitiniphilus purpureus]|uniref:Carboxymuconolactone decarboxylase family protein n=1 Tax=Chitiniphilus purpureus TaxID=2981137 RepID=A0ABY6DIR1_9NEIS|nr:carboxymuconolactone decarboxylase family protein [Chitiniphilus sp. CD1]UXY13922.1 carboxymuconolactone decarboxylase family protein [Chitiniphilus sp. CD1]